MLYKSVYAICLCILLTNSHCSQRAGIVYKSPEGYNLNTPFLLNLPAELDEISGVAFYPKDSSVFAIGDEYGWLYKIPLTSSGKSIRKWKFSSDGDYEDLTMIDTIFYVGITFTPAGDMIISNEAAERGVANLLFFKYNKKEKT